MGKSGPHTSDAPGPTRPPKALAAEVALFAGFLKGRGFRIFLTSLMDALRGLREIDVANRSDFLAVLRANLVSSDLEWAQFEGLFNEFWHQGPGCPEGRKEIGAAQGRNAAGKAQSTRKVETGRTAEAPSAEPKEWLEGVSYSPVSLLEKKDLSRFDTTDIQAAQLALKRLIAPFKIHKVRRKRRSRRPGEMDFPRVVKKSLKTGGVPLELFFKEKKRRIKRLVILADVSGSMDRYARFVMPFLLGLRAVGSRAEVFVFSTSLTSITFMVRHLPFQKALDRISRTVPNWSGGTRIGYSMHQFNQGEGERLLNKRAVVVILSDGWDLGGKDLLRREMETLGKRAHRVIWLNPLAGDPDYEPLSQGLRVALPHVDYHLPANSLQSLRRVGRLLSRVMTER